MRWPKHDAPPANPTSNPAVALAPARGHAPDWSPAIDMQHLAEAKRMNENMTQLRARQETILRHAGQTHLDLHEQIRELSEELCTVYEREIRLLKIIDKRDKQLAQVPGGKSIKPARKSSDGSQSPKEQAIANELGRLQQRYAALSKSKLGRLQLWYWRVKAGR